PNKGADILGPSELSHSVISVDVNSLLGRSAANQRQGWMGGAGIMADSDGRDDYSNGFTKWLVQTTRLESPADWKQPAGPVFRQAPFPFDFISCSFHNDFGQSDVLSCDHRRGVVIFGPFL
uniref:Beta-lactamase domain-containing protein n=1 Tax=Mesocestoides corti TaxID=53468 RepID=A0A5K3FZ55_MESCO